MTSEWGTLKITKEFGELLNISLTNLVLKTDIYTLDNKTYTKDRIIKNRLELVVQCYSDWVTC